MGCLKLKIIYLWILNKILKKDDNVVEGENNKLQNSLYVDVGKDNDGNILDDIM